MAIIYCATHIETGRRYYGQTIRTLDERKQGHFYAVRHGSVLYFHRALQKYGFEAFEWNVVEECIVDDLNDRETHYIIEHNTTDKRYGFNLMCGGSNGVMADETKEKIRRAHLGRKNGPHSKEAKEKMSLARKGKPMPEHQREYLKSITGAQHPHFGRKRSIETKKRMSQAAIARVYDLDARKSFSNAHKTISDDDFRALWFRSVTLEEVISNSGLAVSSVYGRAKYLRSLGVELPKLPRR